MAYRRTGRTLSALGALGVGLGICLSHNVLAAGRGDGPITFRPRSAAAITEIEVVLADRGRGTRRHLPVSDVVMRLRPAGEGRLGSLLSLADGLRAPRGRALFTAEVLVVAGGRLFIEERAQCGAWTAGVSLCRTEGDGGVFAILRSGQGESQRLSLRLGQVDVAEEAGVRLGGCRDGEGEDVVLLPRSGRNLLDVEIGEN